MTAVSNQRPKKEQPTRAALHTAPRDPAERREDALGPNPFLGYDRESLGTYLMSRGALEIAESQFRRAIVVNPFEPRFKRRLAWRLFMQKRYDEAREWIAKALEQKPGDADSLQILRMMEEDLNRQRPSPTT